MDNKEQLAGSGPAACLMKPSWFSSMGKGVYDPALRCLGDHYNIQDIKFALRPLKMGGRIGSATVHWIDPAAILAEPRSLATVTMVEPGRVHTRREVVEARLIVVAAGIWTRQLLPQYSQKGQAGAAFLWRDPIETPFIHPWAPYRQLVAFNRGDGCWVGDGTSILSSNWTTERMVQSMNRCTQAVGRYIGQGADGPQVLQGIRPYAPGRKPCLLEEVSKGLWVASGGAKNGTLAAGWCAQQIRERAS